MTVGELIEFLAYCPNEAEIIITDRDHEFDFELDEAIWVDADNELVLVVADEDIEDEEVDDTEQQVAALESEGGKVIDAEFKVIMEPTLATNNDGLVSLPAEAKGKVVHDV